MISFELFSRLYRETADYTDVDMYIRERGYQAEWMDLFAEDEIGSLLLNIWELAHMNIAQLRERTGLTQRQFAARYNIPHRSVENWEASSGSAHREPPEYLKMLIAYTIIAND